MTSATTFNMAGGSKSVAGHHAGATPTWELSNEQVSFRVDQRGQALTLGNRDRGVNYLRPRALWRLILSDGVCLEREGVPDDEQVEVSCEDGVLRVYSPVTRMLDSDERLSLAVTAEFSLSGEDMHAALRIDHQAAGVVLREVHFPILAIADEALGAVITTNRGGEYHRDVKAWVRRFHTGYVGFDQKYIRDIGGYPAATNAMNCLAIDRGHEGLYCGIHDPEFKTTLHILELEYGQFNMLMARCPFLPAGETYHDGDIVLSPYRGPWTTAASKYRRWADTWFRPPTDVPSFIRDMSGWQRLIMRTQYGKLLFRYTDLISMYEAGASAGIHTLLLFGWHVHGMDNGYPDYRFDDAQGGRDVLKREIQLVQQRGGRVILYFNGQLIDMQSDYYRTTGQRLATKLTNGEVETQQYNFSGPGAYIRKFGNRIFTTACPSSAEWLEVLKGFADLAIDLGCDAVFFDQLGHASYPCCDPNHGHSVPFHGVMLAKRHMLEELRRYVKAQRPDMGIGIECISDVTAMTTDFIHIFGNIAHTDVQWQGTGRKPTGMSFQDFYRYAFPEVILSNREIRDDTDIERRVNMMLLKGCRSDVEVFRCQATIAAAPHYRDYLARANALREKFADLLYRGRYVADTYSHCLDNAEFFQVAFALDERLALMVSQSHLPLCLGTLRVPRAKLLRYDSISGDVVVLDHGDSQAIRVPQHGLAVLEYRLHTD